MRRSSRSSLLLAFVTCCFGSACGSNLPWQATGRLHLQVSASPQAVGHTPQVPPVLVVSTSQGIDLYTEDGKLAGRLPLPAKTTVLAAAGARIFFEAPEGPLQAMTRDGSTTTLWAPDLSKQFSVGAFIVNPDGSAWLSAAQSKDTTTQTVVVGGDGRTPAKVATFPSPKVLAPYLWDSKGVLLDSEPMDYFGYKPFPTPWDRYGLSVMDPSTGSIRDFTTPSGCVFSDQTADGKVACFPASPGYLVPDLHSVRIVDSAGKSSDLSLALPRFKFVGDAYFSPDGSLLTVAGATGEAETSPDHQQPNGPEEFGTDLVQVGAGSIARFGPVGTRPAMGRRSWLPDGRLALWRPDSVGGQPGLYVLDPKGTGDGPEIPVDGIPVGYLTA